jgi:hypothetical protein
MLKVVLLVEVKKGACWAVGDWCCANRGGGRGAPAGILLFEGLQCKEGH